METPAEVTPPPGAEPNAAYRVATPGYFGTIGARFIAGRDFDDADDRDSAPVVVVNETLVRRRLAGRDPIGSRIRLGRGESAASATVVGVVADIRQQSWSDVGEAIFFPLAQDESFRDSPRPPFSLTVVVRAAGDPKALIPNLRSQVAALDESIPLDRLITMNDAVAKAFRGPRMTAYLLSGFSVLALLLASMGVYAVVAQATAARRNEFGVRLAFGARPRDILWLAAGRSAGFIAAGLAAGLALSVWLSAALSDLLFEVSPTDIVSFAAAASVLAVAAFVATYIPAARASRLHPSQALRYE